MASRSLGTLTLDLIAKIGGFTSGMDAAARSADKRAKDIAKSLQGINTAALVVGTALGSYLKQGIDAIASAFPDLIDQAGKFQDIAEKTGGSAEGFAGLAVAAKTGGASIEELADASIKLTKNLTGVDDDSAAAGAAIKALNLNLADFKKQSPDEQIVTLSKSLSEFADGSGKTAVAVALLGKNGANLLPTLKALAEQGGAQNILTKEQIALADDYGDRLATQRAQLSLYASALATQALPAINALTGAMVEFVKQLTTTDSQTAALAANDGVRIFSENAGRFLARLVDYVIQTKREFSVLADFFVSTAEATAKAAQFDFSGAAKIGADFRARYGLDEFGRKQQAAAGQQAGRTFVDAYNAQLAAGARSAFAAKDPRRLDQGQPAEGRPALKFDGPVKDTSGQTKALLANQLKVFADNIADARDLMQARNKFLDLYNQQGLLSIKDYYAQQKNILDEATKEQSAAYDAQIALLQKATQTGKPEARIEAQGKLNEAIRAQAKLLRDAGDAAIEGGVKQQQATKAFMDAITGVRASVLELQGNVAQAAAIKFDLANFKLTQDVLRSGDADAKALLDTLRQLTIAQAQFAQAAQDAGDVTTRLGIEEARINTAVNIGALSQIASLTQVGKARQKAISDLEKYVQAEEAAAASTATTDPSKNRLVIQAEQARAALEQLKATADPLADKFNSIFTDSAGNAFADFITGTKSASDAFKSFANDVVSQVARLAAQSLVTDWFGGGKGGTGFNFGSIVSSFFGGGKAAGGPVLPNTLYRVNEQGPEMFKAANGNQFLMTGAQGGNIVPNNALGGVKGSTIVVNVQMPAGADRRTGAQFGAAAARELAAASRRNN